MPEEYNPYPLNGQYFMPTVPVPQLEAKEKAKQEVLKQVPLLQKVLKRFDQKIAYYESVHAIPASIKLDEKKHAIASLANEQTCRDLQQERSYILGQIDKLK